MDLSFSGFARFPEFRGTINDSSGRLINWASIVFSDPCIA